MNPTLDRGPILSPNAKRAVPKVDPPQPRYLDERKVFRLPVAWRPVYNELARRMYQRSHDALDFAWCYKRKVFGIRPFDYVGRRDQGWVEYTDPKEMAAAIGLVTVSGTPGRSRAPQAVPAIKRQPIMPAGDDAGLVAELLAMSAKFLVNT